NPRVGAGVLLRKRAPFGPLGENETFQRLSGRLHLRALLFVLKQRALHHLRQAIEVLRVEDGRMDRIVRRVNCDARQIVDASGFGRSLDRRLWTFARTSSTWRFR